MKKTITLKYKLKQIVYIKTDPEQLPHIITAFRIDNDGVLYEASYINNRAYFQDFEISPNKDVLKICGLDNADEKN